MLNRVCFEKISVHLAISKTKQYLSRQSKIQIIKEALNIEGSDLGSLFTCIEEDSHIDLPNCQFHYTANVGLVLQDFEVLSNLELNMPREETSTIYLGKLFHRLIDLISIKYYLDFLLHLLLVIQNDLVSAAVCII